MINDHGIKNKVSAEMREDYPSTFVCQYAGCSCRGKRYKKSKMISLNDDFYFCSEICKQAFYVLNQQLFERVEATYENAV